MDETYFNVVYFFKYLVDLQGNSDKIKFCSEVCFKVYFKHYRTKYFIFHILYVAHSYTVPTLFLNYCLKNETAVINEYHV